MKKDFLTTTESNEVKILSFNNSAEVYRKITEKRVEKEDLEGALICALSGLEKKVTAEGLEDVATLYADLGIFALSNRYWFKYLSKAPKEKQGFAFEELAVNSFYLNDLTLMEYYFHKKYELDGFLSRETLDPEIAEFFEENINDKSLYRIVYPEEKIDVEAVYKKFKKALTALEFDTARAYLNAIPEDSEQRKNGLKDLAVAYFLFGKDDEMVSVSKEYLQHFGDDASVYCNLTEFYRMRGDDDKSGYYYQKAISTPTDDVEVNLKLATCAFQRGEHKTASNYFDKIIKDDFYDVQVLTLYGLTLINSGDYQKAYEILSKCYRLDPSDINNKFYVKVAKQLLNGDREVESYLPLSYSGEMPEKVKQKRIEKINSYNGNPKNRNLFKDKELLDAVKWGICDGDPIIAQECIGILTSTDEKKGYLMLSDFLIDERVNDKVKEAIVFVLVLSGEVNKISIAVRNFFAKVKIGKPSSEKQPDGILFFVSYALAFSKLVSAGDKWLDKLLPIANKVYVRLKNKISLGDYSREEVACLMIYLLKLPFLGKLKDVCSIFHVKEERLNLLNDIYKGTSKND